MVYNPANDDDREYAWRHAFAYADSFVSTDDAAAYANYYVGKIKEMDNLNDWPYHADLFMPWCNANEIVRI